MSVAGCMAIDVFNFLIDFSGMRRPDPPQNYKSINLVIHINGENITPKKIEKAISRSHGKHCSGYNALRDDIDVTTSCRINKD